MDSNHDRPAAQNQPVEPLPYAPSRPVGWWRKRRKWLILLLGITAVVLAEGYIVFHRNDEVCAKCRATSEVWFVAIDGWRIAELSRRVHEGPISQAVQRLNGRPCAHDWQCANAYCRGFIGNRCVGTGRALPDYVQTRRFENDPQFEELFASRVSEDSAFLTSLRDAIVAGDSGAVYLLLMSLYSTEEQQP